MGGAPKPSSSAEWTPIPAEEICKLYPSAVIPQEAVAEAVGLIKVVPVKPKLNNADLIDLGSSSESVSGENSNAVVRDIPEANLVVSVVRDERRVEIVRDAVRPFSYRAIGGVKIINGNVLEYRNPVELINRKYVNFTDKRPDPWIRKFWTDPIKGPINIARLQAQLGESKIRGHLLIGDSNAVAFRDWYKGGRRTEKIGDDEVKFIGLCISGAGVTELEKVIKKLDLSQFNSALFWLPSRSISNPEYTPETVRTLRRIFQVLLSKVGHVCVHNTPQTSIYEELGPDACIPRTAVSINSPYKRAVELNREVAEVLVGEFEGKVKFHDTTKALSQESINSRGHSVFIPKSENFVYGDYVGYHRNKFVDNRDHYSHAGFRRIRDVLFPMLDQCAHATVFN